MMRTFLLYLALSACQIEPAVLVPKRPNVLLICVDDLRPELGCYGVESVISPNIDRLAEGGRRFARHYVQAPTCGASRYGMLSGERPTDGAQLGNGYMMNHTSKQPEAERPESFIHHFRRHGYHTVGIGKISHQADGLARRDPDELELPHSWDEMLVDYGKWGKGDNSFFGFSDGSNRNMRKFEVPPFEVGPVGDQGYPDGIHADLALEKLEELGRGDHPFLLAVGFYKPHLPFTAPKKYWDLYERESVPIAKNPDGPTDAARLFLHSSAEFFSRYRWGKEFGGAGKRISDDYAREIRHAYYACVSYIDAQIGRILDRLDALELSSNTIVVLWGDHGWHLGEHAIWGKHSLFERSLHSPLIFRVPGMNHPGAATNSLVGSIDVYPTLCELAGLPIPDSVDGISMVPLLDKPEAASRRPVYSYQRNSMSMRTDRWRLLLRKQGDQWRAALFDHDADPDETCDLAARHPEWVADLRELWNEGARGVVPMLDAWPTERER
ncbi:MAG: sulfatase [Planctomycetes bacterium]|nr:sulfatase [Planctomycetota bacterium]